MQPYRLLSADEQPVAPIQAEFANMGSDDQILVEIELKWTDVVLGAVRHVLSWRRSQFIERVRVQALLGQPFELSSTGTNRIWYSTLSGRGRRVLYYGQDLAKQMPQAHVLRS